ncbi:MAG: hypothetical protein K1X94_17055 [Sandaracinaceae bacterium]|nr:hypothetical protein [Sandaracinaceae bacterium]
MSRAIRRTLGLGALALSSCTFLYDPSQYWNDGGPDTGASGLDANLPPGADADLDAFVVPPPDAYVPPGVDADLDASAPDAVPPDAFAPDAFAPDAFAPDAFAPPTCPASASLGLGACAPINGLRYCDPATGATRVASLAMAREVLPGSRHELSLLGNGNEVADAATGHIADFELAREADRLVAVWLDDTTREVVRSVYTVGSAGLSTPEISRASFGSASGTGTDVSVRPGHVDEVVVGYVDGGAPRLASCPATAFGGWCTETTLASVATGVTDVLVAHADASPVVAFQGLQFGSTAGFFTEVVRAGSPAFFFPGTGPFHGLRSTTGAFVFTTGGAGGSDRVVYESSAASRGLGNDLPRLVRNDAAANEYRLARAHLPTTGVGSDIDVEEGAASNVDGALDCGESIPCTVLAGGSTERQIANSFPELRDWSYDIVGDGYRVATLLVGDISGTEVTVAMWHVGGTRGARLEPIVIGSGRVSPVGDGHALRTVVTRTASTLEVFVLTLVTFDGRDRLYLSGFRLAACGL